MSQYSIVVLASDSIAANVGNPELTRRGTVAPNANVLRDTRDY